MDDIAGLQPRSPPTPTNLLSLPPELLLQISARLPLGTRLLFDRQTCLSLRSISENITLPTPHRLSLAELACAREAIRNAVASSSSDRVSYAVSAGKSHVPATHKRNRSLDASSNDDTILMIRSIQGLFPMQLSPFYMTGTGSRPTSSSFCSDQPSSEHDSSSLSLRTILAVGWHGLPAERLVQMIVMEPLFRDVRTIVKTTQFESGESASAFRIPFS